jgi:hypothetical protein
MMVLEDENEYEVQMRSRDEEEIRDFRAGRIHRVVLPGIVHGPASQTLLAAVAYQADDSIHTVEARRRLGKKPY